MTARFVITVRTRLARTGVACFLWAACGVPVDLGGTTPSQSSEGGDTCSAFAAPDASASCSGCSAGSKTCQPNGCFNGYFCDLTEHDCKAPGAPCSSTVKFDGH